MLLLKGHRDNRKRLSEREKRWSRDQPHIHSLLPFVVVQLRIRIFLRITFVNGPVCPS